MATLAQSPVASLAAASSLARREPSSSSTPVLSVSTGIRSFGAIKSKTTPRNLSRLVVRSEAKNAASATGAGPVTDATFKELVLDSPIPVLVDFWAPWCGPCRMIAPIIDELSNEYQGKLKCLKLNTDESPGVATEYGIRSIPTVMIFKKGKKLDTVIGAVPKATLISTIDKYLN